MLDRFRIQQEHAFNALDATLQTHLALFDVEQLMEIARALLHGEPIERPLPEMERTIEQMAAVELLRQLNRRMEAELLENELAT